MRTIKLTLAYDGTDYAGWQSQPDRPTRAGDAGSGAREDHRPRGPRRWPADGPTPACMPWARSSASAPSRRCRPRCCSGRSTPSCRATWPCSAAEEVPAGFHAHPRRAAQALPLRDPRRPGPRRLRRGYAWHVPAGSTPRAMQRAAAALLGTHDFSSFETTGSPRATSVRTVYDLEIERGRGDADRVARRNRGRRVSLQHGPRDRRHAGRSGPAPATKTGRPKCWRRRSPRRRPDRAAAGLGFVVGQIRRPERDTAERSESDDDRGPARPAAASAGAGEAWPVALHLAALWLR